MITERSDLPVRRRAPRNPATAWLFDIDGVLTDPELKIIKHEGIITEIVRRLRAGEPVGGNTGRSLRFVEDRFLNVIEASLEDRSLLRDIFVVAEKGGTWLVHSEDGSRERHLDPSLMTGELQQLLAEARLFVQQRYANEVFVDETKRTMLSIEMRDGRRVNEFGPVRANIVRELRQLLDTRAGHTQLRIDPTRIAVDVEQSRAGKALGARRFVELLRERNINPRRYVAFGDSRSDYDMAEELHRLGLFVEFVFVGGEELLHGKNSCAFQIVFTHDHCDNGTVEYLTGER